jgi:hypothetical protein
VAELKYPLALVIRAVDRVTGPLQAINARLEKSTARLTVPFRRLSGRLAALSNATGLPKVIDGFKGVGEAAGNLSGKVMGIGKAFTGLVGGALFGGLGLYALVRGAEAAGSRLQDLSTVTGLTVNAFAELEFAAKRSGVENDAFAAGMQKFNKSLSEARRNTGPLAALLTKVGPAYLKQLKAVKSNEEGFDLLAKAMGKIEDPGKRAELAAAAFGKAGAGMVNVLKDGPAGVAALRAEYRRLVGDQTSFAGNADALGDAFDNLELSMMGLRNTAAGALFPALTKLTEAVTGFLIKNRDGLQRWATTAGEAIQKWVDGGGIDRLVASLRALAADVSVVVDKLGGLEGVAKIAAVAVGASLVGSVVQLGMALGTTTVALVGFLSKLGAAQAFTWMLDWGKYLWMMRASIMAGLLPSLTAATASVWGFTVALLANPITWIIAGIVALGASVYLVYKYWEPIKGFFFTIWEYLKNTFGPAVEWVWNLLKKWTVLGVIVENWEPIKDFFATLWSGIVTIFQTAWETMSPIVDKLQAAFKYTPLGLAVEAASSARESFFGGGEVAPAFGAARALPPVAGPAGGEAKVTVDFANLPRGARITPARENTADLDLSYGYSMVGP